MLQPRRNAALQRRKNGGLRPAYVAGAAAVVLALVFGVTVIIHTILGVLSLILDVVVLGVIVGAIYHFFRRR